MSRKKRAQEKQQKEKQKAAFQAVKEAHFRQTEVRNLEKFGHHSMTKNQKKRAAHEPRF